MKITNPIYTAQKECEISQNLNEVDDDDGNKKVLVNWCPRNQTKCRGETVAVSGCDQNFMEGRAESAYQSSTPRSNSPLCIANLSLPIVDRNRVAGKLSRVGKFRNGFPNTSRRLQPRYENLFQHW